MVGVFGDLGLGLTSGCGVVSTWVARSSRPGSTGLEVVKLVEPACERQRVGRVETMVTLSGVLWSGFGCRVWGGFDSAVRFAHVLAQPASEKGRSWAGSTGVGKGTFSYRFNPWSWDTRGTR